MNDEKKRMAKAVQEIQSFEDEQIIRILESYCSDCKEPKDVGALFGCKTCITRSIMES